MFSHLYRGLVVHETTHNLVQTLELENMRQVGQLSRRTILHQYEHLQHQRRLHPFLLSELKLDVDDGILRRRLGGVFDV